jgi:GNAT superfamily N-acetyltransferase
MASPVIRLAESADLLLMSDLMERLLRKHVLKDCSREGGKTLLQGVSPEQLAENLAAGFTYHVAATPDAIYGVAGMKPPCDLHHLFVADVMQRQGLGRKLWQAARDGVCLQHSVPPIFTVYATLNAVPFYARIGFDLAGDVVDRGGVRLQPLRYVMLGARPK